MLDPDVLVAADRWWLERQPKGAHDFIRRVMPTLFGTLRLLHAETSKLPLMVLSGVYSSPKIVSTSYTNTWGFPADADQYAIFRTILSLTGDVYNLVKPIKDLSMSELQELHPHVLPLYDEARKFSGLRNVFTHLGEVVTDMQEHGVSGPLMTRVNIEYASTAKSCVHLIWDEADQRFHYVYQKRMEDVPFDKTTFTKTFDLGRNIYAQLIKYKGSAGHPTPSALLPP